MLIKIFTEGIKSAVLGLLTSTTPDSSGLAPLSMFFMVMIAIIALTLAEIFLGLAIFNILNIEVRYGVGISMLMTVLIYIIQIMICTWLIKRQLKKVEEHSVVIKDYKLIKGAITALIEGYKGK